MWRWISGLPRALRQHIHGHRASTTGVCREEEAEQCIEINRNTFFHKNDKGLFAFSSRSRGGEQSDHGPDQDKWYREYRRNFCSFFDGNHNTLEALGWGAAVVLGIHLSKCPIQQDEGRTRRRKSVDTKHCILWQVAYSLPETRKSIISSQKKAIKADGEEKAKEDPLYKVMNEFEDICKKYTGLGKNIQGLQQAAKNHLSKAVHSWIDASHLGYTKAQFNLGLCYETGKGVKMNLRKAEKYYKLAAEEGHSQALYNLALLYLKGEGCIEKNVPLALELLQKAASNGLGQAQTHLGVYYTEEETQDLEKAVSFFKAAAEQNDPEAQYFLGVCYEEGLGIEVNECKSADLYSKAAASGHDGAMYNLGVFHELGLGGLPEDRVSALMMYQKSADAGNEQAKLQLDKFKAKAAVEEWKYLNPDAEIHQEKLLNKTINNEIHEDKKEDPPLKLSTSISSPSITDYVRNHIDSFKSSSPYNFMDPVFLLGDKSSEKHSLKREITATDLELSSLMSKMTDWKPQYGSPRVTPELPSRVLFSLGADENDIEGLLDLSKDIDLSRKNDSPPQIHHFCSFVHKNSMPNINCVSCK